MRLNRLITSIALTVAIAGEAAVTIYPAPHEAVLNDAFTLEVKEAGGEWHPVDIYAIKVDKTVGVKHSVVNTSMAYFDFDGKVDLRVISRGQRVESAGVRPLSYGISPAVAGDTLTFSLDKPRQLSVEVNGDIFNNLQIFANPVETSRPANVKKWARQPGHIYFGPGYHRLDSAMLIPSGSEVYIAGGAVVDGYLHVVDAGNVRISGRGMIYPAKRGEGIKIKRSHDVSVEGVMTTQLPVGESHDVAIENVKVMSSYNWGDGFNVFASDRVKYRNIFARTSDDCTTVYATRLGHKGGCSDIEIDGAVLWADVAHPFMIGLHGNSEQPDTIQDIVYRNIDVLDVNEPQVDYQGVFTIITGDNNLVRRVTFDNIRVENFRRSKLIDIRIAYNKKYCTAPGNSIEDVTFKDIVYNGDNSELSLIIGYDDERVVRNVRFINLVINGVKISDKMEGKPAWYKTGDMARIYIGEHVENVTFE